MRLGHLERFLDDLDALALQHIGKARVVLEMAVVELGDQPVLAAVPVMNERRDDAARLELRVKSDPLVKLERRRMVGSRARELLEEIILAQRLDRAHLDARLRQSERQTKPHRSRADDDHPLRFFLHHY